MRSPLKTVMSAVVFATVALSASPAAAAPATGCGLTFLPLPDGATRGFVREGEVTGRYAVGHAFIDGRQESVIWKDGVPFVPSLPFGEGGLTDVNSTGVAVGYGLNMDGTSSPVAWSQDGGVSALPVPDDGWSVQAVATNERGDIVGTATDPDDVDGKYTLVWRAGADEPQILPYGDVTNAVDIDEDGTVLAQAGTMTSAGPALVWDPETGTVTSLGEGSVGTAIRGGYVTGWENRTDRSVTMRWDLDGTDVEIAELGYALTVTSDGHVAGLGSVIVRGDGTLIQAEEPAFAMGIEYLADNGTAYGYADYAPAMWTGCR
ncbi:hypothetical protein [Catenuloplanes atrovinosus]|uniref:Extracellular repeat, HAF family n=1 Tax=Catenuloplanes atrovinosus TaxID=137266 RepID=A0AAE3YPN6_9ACTN|nr:hypothetical protein [Catenuloplanes atrovinosus]MDR7276123.1 hypothetical protein [Catenuloplanes atrovinosus]